MTEYDRKPSKEDENKAKAVTSIMFIVTVGIISLIGIILFFGTFYTIPAGHRGVLLTFGKPSDAISDEGLHFKFPIAQSVKKMEVRTQKIETGADSSSKDLQDVQATIALNFHLDPGKVNTLYQEIGGDYKVRIIDPAIQESVKAVSARFTAEQLVTRRPEARKQIQEFLTERLQRYYIIVDDFNMVNFQFSEEFDKAIEAKVTAEQLKLKADRDLERIRVEAEQVRTQAEAEAYSLEMKNKAIKNSPDVVTLKQIEIQEKAIAKWDGILPKVTGDAIPFIGLSNLEENPPLEGSSP